jgi:glutamate-5-semialdehyde dehydrogenase
MTNQNSKDDALLIQVTDLAQKARAAAGVLALATTDQKNKALLAMAASIEKASAEIIKENSMDMKAGEAAGLSQALLDRLLLTEARVKGMAQGLREMADLSDPIGEVVRDWTTSNGLKITQITVPLGVIGMIYEARPNVTAEAAGLCLKSGNAVILRGGSEAFHSNTILVKILNRALAGSGLPEAAAQLLPPHDRRSTTLLSQMTGLVDLIIARGSEEMIKAISKDATVPVLGHGKGVCHVYVDQAADVEKAVKIAFNAKVQRPGVCNAMESLLIHQHLLYDMVPMITEKYKKAGVEIRGDERVTGLVSSVKKATDEDWGKEYHDLIVSMKIVDSLDEAVAHINRFGSGHTDSIITEDKAAAEHFLKAVDSSCVMVNASTRLHDGGVFGFGSEIGISTNKLHARGTMGLKDLTSKKYIVHGTGQVRD